jgi:hypothetical protein
METKRLCARRADMSVAVKKDAWENMMEMPAVCMLCAVIRVVEEPPSGEELKWGWDVENEAYEARDRPCDAWS